MKKIVIIAGEKSGDIYAGLLCKKLKEKYPSLEIFSCAGAHCQPYSAQIVDLLSYSVSGIFEVFSSLKKILRIFNHIVNEINRIKPDLIIPIDFPDFNLRLAKKLNKKYPLFYYVSPQVWAWRKKRIEIIKKYVDKMVVLFKFEEEFYKKEGVESLYFGHPLLEIIEKQGVETKKIISFMPGSRKNEIKKHLPIMAKTKLILEKHLPEYHFCIIRPQNIEESFYQKLSARIPIIEHSYQAIEESEFIITSSGTATIEIAILEVPFLIIYKLNQLSWLLLKKMVKVDFIGMVNILSSKKVIEELLQSQATPEKIAQHTLACLKNKEKYAEIKHQLKQVKKTLSPFGATEKFTDFIGDFLNAARV